MDNSAQDPASAALDVSAQPQTPASNPEEQAAMARGDMPMKVETSIQATAAAESEELQKINEVATAQSLNSQVTAAKDSTSPTTNNKSEEAKNSTSQVSDVGLSKDQIKELSEKVKQAPLPAEFKAIIDDRISRLALIQKSSGALSSAFIMEYEQTSRYVNWVVGLPWELETEDLLDLTKAKEIMDKHHYGLEPLKDRVLQYIASIMLNIKNNKGSDNLIKAPIICVVGLAGTGKTTFAKSMADSLGRSFQRIAFGGMADSRVLRGQSRFFPDAEPGAIIKKLSDAKSKNPVVCLDEVDRVTDSARADIMGVLIEVLDPEQNAHFTDHYIDYPFNLQKIIFIATANNISGIATAVLDRLEIIRMPSYNDDEKIVIGRDFVLPKTMQSTGVLPEQLQIDPDVWEPLVRPLGYDPGIRGLDRLITNMCRKAAMLIVTGQAETVRITNDNVKDFLPQW